jgi:hypothetical protein
VLLHILVHFVVTCARLYTVYDFQTFLRRNLFYRIDFRIERFPLLHQLYVWSQRIACKKFLSNWVIMLNKNRNNEVFNFGLSKWLVARSRSEGSGCRKYGSLRSLWEHKLFTYNYNLKMLTCFSQKLTFYAKIIWQKFFFGKNFYLTKDKRKLFICTVRTYVRSQTTFLWKLNWAEMNTLQLCFKYKEVILLLLYYVLQFLLFCGHPEPDKTTFVNGQNFSGQKKFFNEK